MYVYNGGLCDYTEFTEKCKSVHAGTRKRMYTQRRREEEGKRRGREEEGEESKKRESQDCVGCDWLRLAELERSRRRGRSLVGSRGGQRRRGMSPESHPLGYH